MLVRDLVFISIIKVYNLDVFFYHVQVCGARKCGTPASSILHRFCLPGIKLKISFIIH